MKKIIIIKYGELSTKKDNINFFISTLKDNLKSLDDAITSVFDLWLRNEEIEGLSRLENEDMISYLMRLDVYLKSLKREIKGRYY